jgi:hypothetical protein
VVGVTSQSLTMSAVPSTFSSTLPHALREERRFALVDDFALSNLGSLLIVDGSETQSDPAISSITNCDHDYLFELPQPRERDAQSLRR